MGLDDELRDTAYCPSAYRTFLPSHQHHNLINPTNQVLHMVSCHLDGLSPIKVSAEASMPSCNPQLRLQYPHHCCSSNVESACVVISSPSR
jgi:hypothetical protein